MRGNTEAVRVLVEKGGAATTRHTETRADQHHRGQAAEQKTEEGRSTKKRKREDAGAADIGINISGYSAIGGDGASVPAPSVEALMRRMAEHYLELNPPQNKEDLDAFLEYLDKFQLRFKQAKVSSLCITMKCTSLESLEGLWQAYTSGALNEAAQKYLVTDQVLRLYNLGEFKLKTFIDKEDYRRCKEQLTELEDEEGTPIDKELDAELDKLKDLALQTPEAPEPDSAAPPDHVEDAPGQSPTAEPSQESSAALVEKSSDVTARDELGSTPLHQAAMGGNTEKLTALVEKGGDVNARDGFDTTPLQCVGHQCKNLPVTAVSLRRKESDDLRSSFEESSET